MSISREASETLGLQALTWLVGNDDLLHVFLGASGASVDDLKTQAGNSDFLVSGFDFLLMDDAWVMAFCDETGRAYTDPMIAAQVLGGTSKTHWT